MTSTDIKEVIESVYGQEYVEPDEQPQRMTIEEAMEILSK